MQFYIALNLSTLAHSTNLWMGCFQKYLDKKDLPEADELTVEQLPDVIEKFYCEVEKTTGKTKEKMNPEDQKTYKNTTMRTIRAALARHFREKLSIDIITNECFLHTNQIFKGIQKINKQKGLGKIDSKTPLIEMDLEKLLNYFLFHLTGSPNPQKLHRSYLVQCDLLPVQKRQRKLTTHDKENIPNRV